MSELDFERMQREAGAALNEELRETLIAGIPSSAPAAVHYGSAGAEYAAAREYTTVFDLSDRTQIEITGKDSAEFLNNFCTNDIKKLQPGEGCEAFITSVKGRVLGHVFVFAGPGMLWLDTVPGQDDAICDHLNRYIITEDVTLKPQTAGWPTLFVSGPQAAEKLAACDVLTQEISVGDSRLFDGAFGVARVDWLSQPGYVVCVTSDVVAETWTRLKDAGILPAGAAAFHTLRIEAGFPWYGVDCSDANLPQEVGRTEKAVSFTKGCYLGQEPIARLDAMGHVNRELCVLRFESATLPAAGAAIHAADDDREIGKITSAARLSETSIPVALAYLRTSHSQPGSNVSVEINEERIAATVIERG